MSSTRLLFLHGNREDYQSDSLLHGLRTVLGEACVDVPRRDHLYADLRPEVRASLYGRGFTLYGRLPEVDVRRDWWLERALRAEFDVVVVGDVWRSWEPWVRLRPHVRRLRARGVTVAVVDGGDGAVLYPHGPTWWRQMRPWPLPRAVGRAEVFKRELQPRTKVVRGYGLLPARAADRLLLRAVRPIAFSIPEELIATADEPKTKLLPRHVTDPEVAALVPESVAPKTQASHPFTREEDYYADLRASRFGITQKKAGWETLRHYELAASGCVPCFRDLHLKPAQAAPFGLDDGNSVVYSSAQGLLRRLGQIDEAEYERLRRGALDWARANTTRARAEAFLAALGRPVGG